ncbi:MAG: ATP-binding protein, partial [Elusimicrobia bacterium]|nr:ATP-binding protein [Elusimicrobiota bacterium]
PSLYEVADQPDVPSAQWIETQWDAARKMARGKNHPLLILDEVQKIPGWSEAVKKQVDYDKRNNFSIRVLLLGSSALLVQRGLTESLSGRFELHRLPHWSYAECNECFGMPLKDYFIFGGYPAAVPLLSSYARWGRYVRDSLIETVVGKDVILMSPVQKPALLRQTFGMACAHPAQIMSYQKMTGQLSDAGNTTTIAHYLNLLSAAYLLAVIPRWSGNKMRQRGSIPKIILRDNSLINAMTLPSGGQELNEPIWRGRLVENAVGAALAVLAEQTGGELFYWRERDYEVDYVFKLGPKLLAIEVKSGFSVDKTPGMNAFLQRNPKASALIIGNSGRQNLFKAISLRVFFNNPAGKFI